MPVFTSRIGKARRRSEYFSCRLALCLNRVGVCFEEFGSNQIILATGQTAPDCALHTLIHTFTPETKLPYLGVEPRMEDYPLSDGFPKISLYLFFQGLAKLA